jgi:hypothetical protein
MDREGDPFTQSKDPYNARAGCSVKGNSHKTEDPSGEAERIQPTRKPRVVQQRISEPRKGRKKRLRQLHETWR